MTDLADLFIVRHWDGIDGAWTDVSKPVIKEEAQKIWNEKTENGKINATSRDIDCYQIFPADTVMLYSGTNEMCR